MYQAHTNRGEQLLGALLWDTGGVLLPSVDRSTPPGVPDYAVFLVIATCGIGGRLEERDGL